MKMKSFVFNNFGLKITAVFLALLVWAMITGRERAYLEQILEVSVEYINRAENIDVRVRPETIRVKVKGTSKELERIKPNDFKVKIDLAGVTEGGRLNYFTEDYLTKPAGMGSLTIHPRMIEITVKEFITREVPVRIRYKGNLKPGVVLLDRRIVPEKVKIFGYKSEVSAIANVDGSEWINLAEIDSDCIIKVPLRKENDILKFEGIDTVDVHITVENKNLEKTAENDVRPK